MNNGTSLKNLVDRYGYGITVRSQDKLYQNIKFKIISESDDNYYNIEYDGGKLGIVRKDCTGTNDYICVS